MKYLFYSFHVCTFLIQFQNLDTHGIGEPSYIQNGYIESYTGSAQIGQDTLNPS